MPPGKPLSAVRGILKRASNARIAVAASGPLSNVKSRYREETTRGEGEGERERVRERAESERGNRVV